MILRAASSLLSLLAVAGVASAAASDSTKDRKPNFLFLFNDDQDQVLAGLDYVPTIKKRVQDEGFTFTNHYSTVSLCCPARVALLRGQAAHNTNITFVMPPGGAYEKFVASGQDQDHLPQWLEKAGYRTEYIGKLMNGYGVQNYENAPKGWSHFDGLLDPYTYIYNTPVFSANGDKPIFYKRTHQTDVLRAKATHRLKKLLENKGQPWFLEVAGVAPHQQFNSTGAYPPVPATRHMDAYPDLKAPRTPNFNPADGKHNKPSWVGKLPVMDEDAIAFADETYRRRAQSMLGLDEMFAELINLLEEAGELDNTYIIMSSDHGYHVGQHRIPAGKTLPYREDTNVPFVIRGPGIPRNSSTTLPSTHIDLVPTLLDLAGLPQSSWPKFLDGRSLVPFWTSPSAVSPPPEIINIEYWGPGLIETQSMTFHPSNTYKTLRLVSPTYSYLYSHWCTGETELYDTAADPYELSPIPKSANPRLHNRLNALLLTGKTCMQDSCLDPWLTLHPDGKVRNLQDALKREYDTFYAQLPAVAFRECLAYQHVSNEEPYFPPLVENSTFGAAHRDISAGNGIWQGEKEKTVIPEVGYYGDSYDGVKDILFGSRGRVLLEKELGRKREGGGVEGKWEGMREYLRGAGVELRQVFWRTLWIFWDIERMGYECGRSCEWRKESGEKEVKDELK